MRNKQNLSENTAIFNKSFSKLIFISKKMMTINVTISM